MLLGYAYPRNVTGHPAAIRLSRIISTVGRGVAVERLGTVTAAAWVRVGELAVADTSIGVVTAGFVGDAVLIFGAGRDFEATWAAGLAQDGLEGHEGHCNEYFHGCERIEALTWLEKDDRKMNKKAGCNSRSFARQMGIYMSALWIVSESLTDEDLRRCYVMCDPLRQASRFDTCAPT